MDLLLLSRLQFAATISFHYLYPPLSIGLAVMLVIFEALWLKTNNPLYHQLARFWTKVFALTFALGVATGLVMEFQFGTNWAAYSRYVGDVFGSALAAEGIFAFFLESGFLALLLFGWNKVSRGMHFFATCMVCLGAHFSAVWIVVANSWMQTPAGYHLVETTLGPRAEITHFWEMVFNPSSMERLLHTLCGAWQAGAFLVVSVSAYYLLKNRHVAFARTALKAGLTVALAAALVQLISGHASAAGVAQNQPAKLAAFEGLYETTSNAPLTLFGWVDESTETIRHSVAIPGLLSWLVHGDSRQPVRGLCEFPPEDRPPVQWSFQFYHGMVAIGVTLIAVAALGFLYFWKGSLFEHRWLLWVLVLSVLGPQLANQLGWFAAEVGRQPWLVYGLMRTSDGLSAVVPAEVVLTSLILFTLIYLLLFAVFVYLLNDKIQHGPDDTDLTPTGKLALPTRA
ncbi:MAG TPA: cytochrome ubiquinol oxidase subunit I [Verrucomicrobiota bacterium]|jgi:cytochrome d ubiquinol oxidase subunit I|nr:cytochrome ubiquinol oxidase subunit I [Verrucomicrobiota bacterium]OQB88771.1 MAG: Cytochrome bd-I ubiquinol oxidase subunit 1 [Verrucomicrobia bacterium ADurb.Bin118]HPY31112.1 cytochrome ubiquinol oxidase subunit I [Verrucomicrobiota bacterium]HQB17571.1 cytochrome ubiquinol oxidase subunit I [Verrucomicrobiota bacterium]